MGVCERVSVCVKLCIFVCKCEFVVCEFEYLCA